jgi:hypothetical protein
MDEDLKKMVEKKSVQKEGPKAFMSRMRNRRLWKDL